MKKEILENMTLTGFIDGRIVTEHKLPNRLV